MTELNLIKKDKLQGPENFPFWYSIITSYLKAKKLTKFILKDIKDINKITRSGDQLSKKEITERENLEAQDALASTILLTNVCDKIKMYIKDCENAYTKMAKIKKLYKKDNSGFYDRKNHYNSKVNPKGKINKNDKLCIIYNNKGHFAKDCYFNPCGTNRRNKRCKYLTNNKKIFNKNKSLEMKRDKTIENIEPNNNKEFTPFYKEIQSMFSPTIDSIEQINEYNVHTTEYSLWTFDSGASEHITNNITLLKTFHEEQTTMKCANNSVCNCKDIKISLRN
ncbi:hypothetical protein PIROE2DRAFT_1553 [Piromyces sp. E2]|nr:hypothetical protein PIROE2DRAFT_1553 [Piromyces sp. E2]|eukprot:OUM70393.1 hypothetical protein PIROE2DRAFT_1553 [Piromyces sp. E2]